MAAICRIRDEQIPSPLHETAVVPEPRPHISAQIEM